MSMTCRSARGYLAASTALIAALAAHGALAEGVHVTLMTAVPAESEKIFTETIERAGGVNTFAHARKPATVETQTIVRSQSDMLYSQRVLDANHGQIGVVYCGDSREVTAAQVSTEDKHICAMLRTSTDTRCGWSSWRRVRLWA